MIACAKEFSYLARSPEALLMGDAFTAIADDEYTLFYNPAALGRNKGVSVSSLNPTFGFPDVYHDRTRFTNFPKTAAGITGKIIEYPIYLQTSAFPTLKMGQFGMTLIADSKTSLVLHNAIHPVVDLNYRYDRGFVAGYVYNIGSGAFSDRPKRKTRGKINTGRRFSFGIAIKHINRQGIDDQFDLFGTSILNKISSGVKDVTGLQNAFGYSSGSGWGVDLGSEYAYSAGRSLFTAGFSILDVGTTYFSKTSGTGNLPRQDMAINSGVAFKQDFGVFDYTLSADLHPLLSNISFSRQIHLGTEFAIPLVSVYSGWSEGYVSYGFTVKLWPIKLTTGLYGIETGTHYRQQEAKRMILYLSLFDFSIDL
jgi:hypothetical protein